MVRLTYGVIDLDDISIPTCRIIGANYQRRIGADCRREPQRCLGEGNRLIGFRDAILVLTRFTYLPNSFRPIYLPETDRGFRGLASV